MPRKSDRKLLIEDVERTLLLTAVNSSYFDEEYMEDDFENVLELLMLLYSSRFVFPRINTPKSRGLRELFWILPPNDFKQMARMDKESFEIVLELISDDPIFHTDQNSHYKQQDVWVQLLVTLERIGMDGNGVSAGRTARAFGIGKGTVCLYTEKVISALLKLKDRFVSWPSVLERHLISSRIRNRFGLPACIGILDGTHINFATRPSIDSETFFNRKKCYSYNVQLICDDKRKVLFYLTGWPGSVHDSTIFGTSQIKQNERNFFTGEEYLLGDSGYALDKRTMTPYKGTALENPLNQEFNKIISAVRVVIEHVNGILKGRWSSLRGIRRQINKHEDFLWINNWIVCAIILHNILVELNDHWADEYLEDNDGDLENSISGTMEGSAFREALKGVMCL